MAVLLEYAAEELKGDCEIVVAAVSKHGRALRFGTQELKGDEEIIKRALEQSRSYLVGLQVRFLSRRCCCEVFHRRGNWMQITC